MLGDVPFKSSRRGCGFNILTALLSSICQFLNIIPDNFAHS
jgi:hypothetical protein